MLLGMFLFVSICLFIPTTMTQCNSTLQRDALLQFYNAAGGSHWINSTGWSSASLPCTSASGNNSTWYGVGCGPGACVVELVLPCNNLTGRIVGDLANITSLQKLELAGMYFGASNNISHVGPLDPRCQISKNYLDSVDDIVFNLDNLTVLDLSFNHLNGSIPGAVGRSLKTLLLNNNAMKGKLPDALLNSTTITELFLQFNFFEGTIPRLPQNATRVNVEMNAFLTSPFPSNLASMTNLQQLFLSDSGFRIPSWSGVGGPCSSPMPKLPSSLLSLTLTQCNMTGIKWSELDHLAALEQLEVNGVVGLEGSLPANLGSSGAMKLFMIFLTPVSGTIPTTYARWHQLEKFEADFSALSGTIPTGFGNMTNLLWFSAERVANTATVLSGTIPFQRSANLTTLNLSGNNFSGPIPAYLGQISRLQSLSLARNRFTGTIPSTFGESWTVVEAGTALQGRGSQRLDFSFNNLQGYVPGNLIEFSRNLIKVAVNGNPNMRIPLQNESRCVPPHATLNSCLTAEYHLSGVSDFYESFSCQRLTVGRTAAQFEQDPSYASYIGCRCAEHFFGRPGIGCYSCVSMYGTCDDGYSIALDENVWAALDDARCPYGFCGLLRCEGEACAESAHCSLQATNFTDAASAMQLELICEGDLRGGCAEGYDPASRLCSACVCNDQECYSRHEEECVKCPSSVPVASLVLVLCAIGVVVVFHFWRSNLVPFVEVVLVVALLVFGATEAWFVGAIVIVFFFHSMSSAMHSQSGLVKVLIMYCQAVAAINERDWPDWVYVLLQKLHFANFSVGGLECLWSGFASPTAKYLGVVFLPPLVIAFLLLCFSSASYVEFLISYLKSWCVAPKAKDTSDDDDDDDDDEDTALMLDSGAGVAASRPSCNLLTAYSVRIVIFVLHAAVFEVASASFAVFRCSKEPATSGHWFVKPEDAFLYSESLPWLRCSWDVEQYATLFALAVVFGTLYGVGVPALFYATLRSRRGRLRDEEVESTLGFLYEDCSEGKETFGVWWIVLRVLLAASISVVPKGSAWHSVAVGSVLLGFILVLLYQRPFAMERDMWLAVCALLVINFTFLAKLNAEGSVEKTMLGTTVFTVNALYFLILCVTLIRPIASSAWRNYRNRPASLPKLSILSEELS